MEEYPSNSKQPRKTAEKPKVERITSADAVRRRKPISKQLAGTFIGGSPKNAMNYVIFDVLVPAARDALADAGSQGLERLIFGESRFKSRPKPGAGVPGYVAYNRMSSAARPGPPTDRRELNRRARALHDFDDIVISSRGEAEQVVERLFDLLSQFGSASVADLYELTGVSSTHADHKWGWTDLEGSGVSKVRGGGYLLDLPDPDPLS